MPNNITDINGYQRQCTSKETSDIQSEFIKIESSPVYGNTQVERTQESASSLCGSKLEEQIVFLKDKKQNGEDRDWQHKKKRSLLMAEHFNAAGLEKKAERISGCANVLMFKKTSERLRLYQTWFCKARLCPMCNWRRSLKIAFQNKRVIERANEKYKLRWVFLTLTVRNVPAEDLKNTIEHMSKSFDRLFRYKRVKTSVKGFFRALEVTKNNDPSSDFYGTYHPHYHVLIAVPPHYFTVKEYYIKKADWQGLWKKAARLDYDPVVHIQAVKPKKSNDVESIEKNVQKSISDSKAVYEVSKYPVKDTDIIGSTEEVTEDAVETVKTLDFSLARKRLISYGGILKEIHAELNLSDAEDGDLIQIDEDKDEIANGAFEVMAYWHPGYRNYVMK